MAATETAVPLHVYGWLELLRVISELIDATRGMRHRVAGKLPVCCLDISPDVSNHRPKRHTTRRREEQRMCESESWRRWFAGTAAESPRHARRGGPCAPDHHSSDPGRTHEGSFDMRIGVTEVFVDDQDKARSFYTGVVGLLVKDDAPYGDTGRWLTVVSPEDPDGTQLLLAPTNDAAVALQAARREAGTPAVSFTTEDCTRAYEELRGRGAVFVAEPQAMSYGGTDAVFDDGCGNLLSLHQE
jgi:catechol 2,3-dioxygenase-like lactoylglutathione lyase family enzyme